MSKHIFALLIGINKYKSATISNLQSCTNDARRMRNWLLDAFNVPADQIRLLLDSKATKRNIEDSLMEHLVNNPSIERGDAIVIYFAGHGSCLSSPTDWFQSDANAGLVQIICPHDHDMKLSQGRNAGISDRSFNALVEDLISAKGDNVTVLLDCCFSPSGPLPRIRNRRSSRWTTTAKAVPNDLYRCLWVGARGKPCSSSSGFSDPKSLYMVLTACPPGGNALEDNSGGQFTTSFLRTATHLPLHRTSYLHFIDHLQQETGDQIFCTGKHKDKNFFGDVPFIPDSQFFSAILGDSANLVRLKQGAIHGIAVGTEIFLHLHNYSFSFNPPIALCFAFDIQPTCSIARLESQTSIIPRSCWAKISRWNNPLPLRIYIKTSFVSFLRSRELQSFLSIKRGRGVSKSGINVLQVRRKDLADISVRLDTKDFLIENTQILSKDENRVTKVANKPIIQAVDDAARFRFHLIRRNSNSPLQNLIDMEIYRFDLASSSRIGENFLQEGVAVIPYRRGDVYNIKFQNSSQINIWPYLVYMDPARYSITLLYSPALTCKEAPLSRQSSLEIGPYKFQLGSGPLSFDLPENGSTKNVYLKLFLSSVPVNLKILEQDPVPQWFIEESLDDDVPCFLSDRVIWDTALASLIFVLDPQVGHILI